MVLPPPLRQSNRHQRPSARVSQSAFICIHASTVAPGLPRESSERGGDSSPGGPQMAQKNLVCKSLPAAARPALGDPTLISSVRREALSGTQYRADSGHQYTAEC
ncbi:UNVERIFIED_CONTAM: hypothetical protein FKN15_006852 [Acipenser sinensis]